MIDPDAVPIAHYTPPPTPIPLHWQEEVKAGLDQEVATGIIEPVQHMVICMKKMANHAAQLTSKPLTYMPSGKLTTHKAHSTRPAPFPVT